MLVHMIGGLVFSRFFPQVRSVVIEFGFSILKKTKNNLAQFEKCLTQNVFKLGSYSSSCSIFEHQKVASSSISDLFRWLRLGLVPGSRYVCSPCVPSPPPFLPDPYSALATQPAHPQVDVQKSPSSDLMCATKSLTWLLRGLKSPLRSLRSSWGWLVASLIPRTSSRAGWRFFATCTNFVALQPKTCFWKTFHLLAKWHIAYLVFPTI